MTKILKCIRAQISVTSVIFLDFEAPIPGVVLFMKYLRPEDVDDNKFNIKHYLFLYLSLKLYTTRTKSTLRRTVHIQEKSVPSVVVLLNFWESSQHFLTANET